jgi:hypothetical protein
VIARLFAAPHIAIDLSRDQAAGEGRTQQMIKMGFSLCLKGFSPIYAREKYIGKA